MEKGKYMRFTPGLCAIDPGASGGIALCECGLRASVSTENLPDSKAEISAVLRRYKSNYGNAFSVYLEDPPKFLGGAFLASMAKLQYNVGFIEGVLMGLNVRVVLVQPRQWQKALHLGAKKDDPKGWKRKLKDEAQRRFPGVDVTLKTADSLLILEYAAMVEAGK